MARNISYIHDYFNIRSYDVYQEMDDQHIENLSMSLRLLNNSRSIREITNEFDTCPLEVVLHYFITCLNDQYI